MDRRVRQVAGLLTVLLLAIALSSGWIQGLRADSIATSEPASRTDPGERARNRFRIFQECRWRRGDILSADGQVLAETVEAPPGRRCLFERRYPSGDLVPHVVGRWSLHFGKTGLEAAYNEELVGPEVPPESLAEVFQRRPHEGRTLVSTIDTRLQRIAIDALGGRRGGIVALNPTTGAVLVAASVPSYDPNPLASNDRNTALQARCELGIGLRRNPDGSVVTNEQGEEVPCENLQSPLLSVALQSRRPPGSSFKVVTAAAALESGTFTPTSPSAPSTSAYTAPGDTRAIHNYGGGTCGGNLTQALRISCNTAFARFAVEVGADQLQTTSHAMGLDRFSGPDFVGCDSGSKADIQETRTGCLPAEIVRYGPEGTETGRERLETPGFRARAGFGQWAIQTSPFGMALVAGTVANSGFVPRPRFADRVIDETGATLREIRTGVGAAAMSRESAASLGEMMRGVVTSGTAARAFRGFGFPAAGKTGTAQQPSCAPDERAIFGEACGDFPHAWFISYAPVDDPAIAIAVLVERGGGSRGATGGGTAAPIAREVMEAFFRLYPTASGPEGG